MKSSEFEKSSAAPSTAGAPESAESARPATVADGVKPQITPKQAERINQPVRNMIISMVVLLACVLPVIWLMPKPDKDPYQASVDLPKVAFEAGEVARFTPTAPQLENWHYNYARWYSHQADGISYWETGQITAAAEFLTVKQADAGETNVSWIAQQTGNSRPIGAESIAGVEWEVREGTTDKDETLTYYVGEVDGTTVIIYGDAPGTEFAQLAEAIVNYQKAPTATASPTATSGTGIE
ncbi:MULTISPECIES: DUF4245 domain-containing protein [unclassified Rothia (in: high G+C Gram-positive bacteria)]|uniref:DUF4245 domain-containing protein n=1 Tax=unclassified Rothia (in: high G+C Gram-positive bacteria) TaxID=2689056 RepID=UPI00195B9AA9|nr:DUF4245 domain-containing protein [Rothia sp. ZJ932]MBM7051436.1 DUF4245 domain-containing protein [Rothia sp. ZJ1223]QRZ61228.1 DUF4245 domain-containing protein [Rothia sp. ZJ932]